MKVLILSRKPELYSVRRLDEEFKAAGHSSVVMDPETPDVLKQTPDLVVPRFGSWKFEESLSLVEYFERRRVAILNRVNPLRDARQKWICSLLLREEGLPMPATTLATKGNFPDQYPFVAKIPDLLTGDGVFLIRGPAERLSLPVMPEWIVQEFISEAAGQDHRVVVGRQGFIAAMKRQAPAGEFRSNLALGGEAHPYTPTSLEIEVATKACETLKLDIAAVDLLPSRRGPLICEVNGCPGLEGIEKASGVNVAAAYVHIGEELHARR